VRERGCKELYKIVVGYHNYDIPTWYQTYM